MNLTLKPGAANDRWASERGAALVMTLLISTLLLIAGGALILTTSMSAGLAIDSTTELQAYYSAEAGLNASLNVLRANIQNNATKASFRNAADNPTLSPWLTYTGTTNGINGVSVVSLNTNPTTGFTVNVTDPDAVLAPANPSRLLVRVTGYGPKGSSKRMEVMVNRQTFGYIPLATILIRGNDDNVSIINDFNVGESNAKTYTGYDHLHPATSIPVFGVTHANDFTKVTQVVTDSKPATLSATLKIKQYANSELPWWLQNAYNARQFLNDLQASAKSNHRYFTGAPDDFGSTTRPKVTFIDGNAALRDGAGLLVVTGELTCKGNEEFHGLILVLGKGKWVRSGGGNGDTYGATVVAKFSRTWPSDEVGAIEGFGTTTYDMSGSGNSTTGYDSEQVDEALNAVGLGSLAIREY